MEVGIGGGGDCPFRCRGTGGLKIAHSEVGWGKKSSGLGLGSVLAGGGGQAW